ncbi:MAG: hypothetical protein AB7P33_03660 [Dehalococcoidia bacterium]
MTHVDGQPDEELERFFERRREYFQQIDALRAEASALWEKYRSDGTISMTEVARLEGIRHQRQTVFDSYQSDEASFIDLVLKRRQTT